MNSLRLISYYGTVLLALLFSGCKPVVTEPVASLPIAEPLQFQWQYQQFLTHQVAASGRVIDAGENYSVSTSEGQAYGMWFALLSQDQPTFNNILLWADQNLAKGALGDRLSAWQWGRDAENNWHILDDNPASDADVWMAYALFSAAELWQEPRYHALAQRLARRVLEQSSVVVAQQRLLLPGPKGFEHANYWLVNPSYYSLTLFRGLASYTGDERWREIYQSSVRTLEQLAAEGHGVIPDWLALDQQANVLSVADTAPEHQAEVNNGDYDAIRTYLWLTWEATQQPQLPQQFGALYRQVLQQGYPAEIFTRLDGQASGRASIGFSAVILPYLQLLAGDNITVVQEQQERIVSQDPQRYQSQYYDRMLLLFGLASQQCIVFSADGRLNLPEVSDACAVKKK